MEHIQSEEAIRMQHQWGDRHCDHPSFAKEYYLATQTGDYVCTQCGEVMSKKAMEYLLKNRK